MVRVKDYMTTEDFTKQELLDILNLSILIKKNIKAGHYLNVLFHKTLGMILSNLQLEQEFRLKQR